MRFFPDCYISRCFISVVSLFLFTSCFTGIESTPKITAKHLSKEGIAAALPPEESFLRNICADSLGSWHPGKLFYITDSRISIALEPSKNPMPLQGETIEFVEFYEVPSMTGKPDTELLFRQKDSTMCAYRINMPVEELKKKATGIEIPFTIEMSIVDKAREALIDSVFYIRTPVWHTVDGNDAVKWKKFIPVRITAVEPGNQVYPLRVCFTPVDAGDGSQSCVYMSVSDKSKSGRNFSMLFSLSDPRLRYPEITDEVWANIQNGRVAKFMTRDECRIALGAPKSIQRRNIITVLQEMWTYENGVYLLFDDGILQSYRQ